MAAAGAGLMLAAPTPTLAADARPKSEPFRYCLNMGTIRGQNLTLVEEIETAAKAGYDGVEPWSRKIDAYVKEGGSLKDLGKRISDLGLTVDSAIAFSNWIVDDDAKRAQALEEAKRNMDALAQIGGTRIFAPPHAAKDGTKRPGSVQSSPPLPEARCELGDQMGVVPPVTRSGASPNHSRDWATQSSSLSKPAIRTPVCCRTCITFTRGIGFWRLADGGRQFDSRVPRQRLPGRPAIAETNQRFAPRLPRRRHRAADRDLSDHLQLRLPAARCRWNYSTATTGSQTH